MIEILKSILLGVVEGITEWLPISSTGHLILFNELLNNKPPEFTASDLYIYVIQLGAILAVVTAFFHKLNPFSAKKTSEEKHNTWQLWFKVIAACIPAAVIGLLLNDFMESFENWQVVSAALIVYGIAFIVIEKLNIKTTIHDLNELSYKNAVVIGMFQVLSIIPGTSRSGSTIIGGMLSGCSREVAAEFSFFLAIPVMFGVSFLKIIKNLDLLTGSNIVVLLIGMIAAYLVSLAAIKFLMNFVKNHSFTAFGIYRIILAVIVIISFAFFGL